MGAMRYYPLFLDLKDKDCRVIGGGKVAERKVKVLLKCSARVSVHSPVLSAGLKKLGKEKKIIYRASGYTRGSLRGAFLVIAATDDRSINSRVSADCRKNGILVNVVDVPRESNFIVPSFIEKNGLVIAISTSGQAPCLAKKIRQDLTSKFIPRYSELLKELTGARKKLKATCPRFSERKSALNKLINSKLTRRKALR
jgi:precorrin-2 dehydrogenase / sirohydrochlorin ferrochelatase